MYDPASDSISLQLPSFLSSITCLSCSAYLQGREPCTPSPPAIPEMLGHGAGTCKGCTAALRKNLHLSDDSRERSMNKGKV